MLCSDDQRASFETHGWLVLREVVRRDRIAGINQAFDNFFETLPGPPVPVRQLPGVCRRDDLLLKHLYEGLAATICNLLGAPSLQLLQDSLLFKAPAANGVVALHQDYAYTGFLDPPAIVSVGLALTDASVENGCLYVVDGSHKWGLAGNFHIFADTLTANTESSLSVDQQRLLSDARIPLEVRAGDVTIHHCLTFHGSYPNTSTLPRKTIVTHVFSSDCKLVSERLPKQAQGHFQTDEHGRLTGSGFPVLGSGSNASA
jgi:ectoine hydroxylase-related dioxygenase (phytanoyl-CoA dioxygenase family)